MTIRSASASPVFRAFLVCLGCSLLGCGADPLAVEYEPSHTLTISVGRELDVVLGTAGPGEYASPPTVSSAAIQFLDVQPVLPAVPAGPRQRFRFATLARGETLITFHHTGAGQTVQDTVLVD